MSWELNYITGRTLNEDAAGGEDGDMSFIKCANDMKNLRSVEALSVRSVHVWVEFLAASMSKEDGR